MKQNTPKQPLTSLLESYRQLVGTNTATHRDLAVLEEALWEARVEATSPRRPRVPWVVALTGAREKDVDMRTQLYTAEPATAVLWARVDRGGDMTPSTAIQVVRDARRMRALEHTSFEEAVQCVLATYDALPVTTCTNDGRVIRKKAQGNVYTRKAPTSPPPSSRRLTDPTEAADEGQDRQPWWRIRDLVHEMVDARLATVEESLRESIRKELDTECKLFVATLQTHLRNATQRARRDQRPVSMGELKQACETLAINPPSRASQLDRVLLQAWFTQAKNAKNRMVRQYHPDTRGDDRTLVQYEETVRAYELARRYFDEQLPRAVVTKEEETHDKENKG